MCVCVRVYGVCKVCVRKRYVPVCCVGFKVECSGGEVLASLKL